jgi:aromatic ring-opening dioxygenase catalytic subunit (LigB family)
MPEQKMTYEERVNAAAETYANSHNSYIDFPTEYKDKSDFQYEGKKQVAAQAEAIREALRAWGVREEDIHNHILEHGYIEPKNQEDGLR